MILEIGDDPVKEFQFAVGVQNSGIAKTIYLTAPQASQEVFQRALEVGARGFFAQPINIEEVRSSLLKYRSQSEGGTTARPAGRKGRIINVFGAKGGVGTTTVAVNLAASLNELEGIQAVALIDINQLFGDLPLFLNIEPPLFDWMEISKNIARLDATYLMSVLSKHSSGVYVLPSPTVLVDDPTVPQVLETLLKLMQTMFDYIIVDSGQALDATSRAVLRLSDRVLLVTILSLPCLVNVKRFQDVFRRLGYPTEERVEIIVNRLAKNAGITLEEAEDTLNRKILWTIPNDYRITMSAINQGKPLNLMAKGADATSKVRGLASLLAGKTQKKEKKRAFFGLRTV
jgi:pilus assembly protein CpaE